MAFTFKRKNITFSKIGELTETNSEFVTTEETRRIIMRDGFHYFQPQNNYMLILGMLSDMINILSNRVNLFS